MINANTINTICVGALYLIRSSVLVNWQNYCTQVIYCILWFVWVLFSFLFGKWVRSHAFKRNYVSKCFSFGIHLMQLLIRCHRFSSSIFLWFYYILDMVIILDGSYYCLQIFYLNQSFRWLIFKPCSFIYKHFAIDRSSTFLPETNSWYQISFRLFRALKI